MEGTSNAVAGSVYVMNLTSQDLNLSTNGMPIRVGTISGWNPPYQPAMQAVPRTLNASDGPGNFFNGNNSLMLQWLDGLYFASIRIDGSQLPLNQDLILVITFNAWQLVNQFAVQVASGDVNPMSALRDAVEMADAQAG